MKHRLRLDFFSVTTVLAMVTFDAISHSSTLPKTLKTQKPAISRPGDVLSKSKAVQQFSLPGSASISFIENRGQFDPQVRYYVKSGNTILWFTNFGIVFDVSREKEPQSGTHIFRADRSTFDTPNAQKKMDRLVFSEEFSAPNRRPEITPCEPQPGIYNYFLGTDRSNWQTDVRSYSQLIYHNVWPGIDVRFVAKQRGVEQEFLVHAGADPSLIRITYNGINNLKIERDGSLAAITRFGHLLERAPIVYQEHGNRLSRDGRFELVGEFSYMFRIGSFDRSRDLVVDPTLLYSTYLGGSSADYGYGIAADNAGNSYVVGYTNSSDFPTGPVELQDQSPGGVAFVTKFGAPGIPVYSTFLGLSRSASTVARGVAVDAAGDAYVTGNTAFGLPTTDNALQTSCGANSAFLTKFNPAGDALLYSTCLGTVGSGESGLGGFAVAVNPNGVAFVTGRENNIQMTSGAYQSAPVGGDANPFLCVLDTTRSGTESLLYSTYIGGAHQSGSFSGDFSYAVAADDYGNAYIAGVAESTDFPTTPHAIQSINKQGICGQASSTGGCGNAFIAKFNPGESGPASLIYSTLLGGSTNGGGTTAYGLAVDASGNAYVVGSTGDNDFSHTDVAFEKNLIVTHAGFVTKIDTGGSHLIYSSFVEPTTTVCCQETEANGVAIDKLGNAYIVGSTRSPSSPVTRDAAQRTSHGGPSLGYDAYLIELNAQGSEEIYGSYLGGTNEDYGAAIALDPVGDVYVTGNTISSDFPVSSHAFQPSWHAAACGNCTDAFVTKFPLGAPGELSINGITPNIGGNGGTVTPEIFGSGFHGGVSVDLRCGSQSIPGTNPTVGTMGRLLNATFDLTKTAPGVCDVVVTDVDGTSVKLGESFTVQEGGAPNIQVVKLGTPAIKPNDEHRNSPINVNFFITVTNIGNIDTADGFLSDLLDNRSSLTSVNPPDLASAPAVNSERAASSLSASSSPNNILWRVPPFAAGQDRRFLYSIQIDSSTPASSTLTDPTCYVVDLAAVCRCIAQNPDLVDNCGSALTSCLLAIPECHDNPRGLKCIASALGCFFSVRQCYRKAQPIITDCIEKNTRPSNDPKDCDPYVIPIFGNPFDPNRLVGPDGTGNQRWLRGGETLPYVVSFGNEAQATAPAQQAVVNQLLDTNMDMSTLSFAGFSVPNGGDARSIQVAIPPGSFNHSIGLDEFTTNVDLRPTQDLLVRLDAKLNAVTRSIMWTFTSIDPRTGLPPTDRSIGFLPPGTQGSIFFTVRPTQGLPTGTTIHTQASVVFNTNQPVPTNPWSNRIDNTPPISKVDALPSAESTSSFPVSWSGTDDGSGIQYFTIYVSDDEGPFTPWLTNTGSTHATYTGVPGHTYRFYSIARDLVGNVEAAKTTAEATTTVQGSSSCATDISSQLTITRGGFRFDHATNSFIQNLTITNNGAALSGVALVLDNLSSTATLSNSGGLTACDAPLGNPWIAIPGALGSGQSISMNLSFIDPTKASITYSTRVLAGNGQK
jgi:hypothetical protein